MSSNFFIMPLSPARVYINIELYLTQLSSAGSHEIGGLPQPPMLLWNCCTATHVLHCNRLATAITAFFLVSFLQVHDCFFFSVNCRETTFQVRKPNFSVGAHNFKCHTSQYTGLYLFHTDTNSMNKQLISNSYLSASL